MEVSMRLLGVGSLMLSLVCAAGAQTTSRLSGSVVDSTGAAVPAATVEVYLPNGSKPVLSMPTTADGLFSFTAVLPGEYDVNVTAKGFRKAVQRGVTLSAGQETAL